MSDALFWGFLLVLFSCLVVDTVGLVWHAVCAGIRALQFWRALKDVRRGSPIPLAVIHGRLYMDALHPAAPYALWALRRKAARFIDQVETRGAEGVPPGHSSGGLQ